MKNQTPIKIALAGNPNSGKTTLFNSLTGSNQFVGNWPGVTVEKKEGHLKGHDDVTIIDLPGIYSLSPYTLEEVVARNYLINERPDAILNIIDGTNLERNLYLTTQLIEIGIPVVVAINMIDVVKKRGDKIKIDKISANLGCPIIEISALRETGVLEAAEAAIRAARENKLCRRHSYFSGVVEHALAHIEEATVHHLPTSQQRWYAIKIFERDEKVCQQLGLSEETVSHIEKDIAAAEEECDDDAESIITNERYIYVEKILEGCYKRKNAGKPSTSDKIDMIVTNRFLAFPIFAAIMFLIYYISVSTVGTWATDWANDGLFGEGFTLFGKFIPGIPVIVENWLTSLMTPEWLNSLLIDGIIGGVGAVLGFVPQMVVLFTILAFLEACGYMSRIAFVLDKLFRRFGLSGKSFIPMLVGVGCSVPGIMASRTIENEKDRKMTIITTSFVPCGAKLPVISLVATELFGGAWWVAPSAYFMGIAAVLLSGIILKKTKLFAGEATPFVMELPEYHMPTVQNLFRSVWERASSFVKKAGTVILLASIVIWTGSVFGFVEGKFCFDTEMAIENSILGLIGGAVSWFFRPLGFGNSVATVATIMGLVAKEEIIGVFGVLDISEMGKLASYSFLAFNLLCAPCFAAIGAIRREMNSGKWTLFAIGYQTVFAYGVSLMLYQFGLALSGNINIFGFAAAVCVLAFLAFMFLKPYKTVNKLK